MLNADSISEKLETGLYQCSIVFIFKCLLDQKLEKASIYPKFCNQQCANTTYQKIIDSPIVSSSYFSTFPYRGGARVGVDEYLS